MMRKVQVLFLLLMLPFLAWAQTRVNASEIITKINRGEAVSYKNVAVVGDLDMTKLQNMKQKNEGRNKNGTKEFISTVTGPLTFVNCTFKGDVLGYFSPDKGHSSIFSSSNEVYNTNFESDVLFENCVFEKKSAFKYSEFNGKALFTGSRFTEEALFKYSEFSRYAYFANARFNRDANFKYVKFPEAANFSGVTFDREANFKYAKFDNGVNFQQALFNGLANFKYTKLSDEVKLKGASLKKGSDFKYTKLNNKSVSLASLQDRDN